MDANPRFFGGTEYMITRFKTFIEPELTKLTNYNVFSLPGNVSNLNNYDKPGIIWLHNLPTQFGSDIPYYFSKPKYTQYVQQVIVPSNFVKKHLLENYTFEQNQIIVIPNAIDPLTFNEKKYDRTIPKLIYTSNSARGLEMLLQAADKINVPFELEIFTNMNPHIEGFFEGDSAKRWILELLEEKPNIKMYGKTNKVTLRRHIEDANIFAYPSTYLETSCISLIEAMSAGVYCVVSKTGALPETGKRYPAYFEWQGVLNNLITQDQAHDSTLLRKLHSENYGANIEIVAKHLEQALFTVQHQLPDMQKQVAFANRTYNWERIKDLWLEWHDELPENP